MVVSSVLPIKTAPLSQFRSSSDKHPVNSRWPGKTRRLLIIKGLSVWIKELTTENSCIGRCGN